QLIRRCIAAQISRPPRAGTSALERLARRADAAASPAVEADAGEDVRRALLDASDSRLRALRARDVEDVAPLPPRRQRVEGLGELPVFLQDLRQLFRQLELALRLEVDLAPLFLHGDGLLDVRLQHG